MRKLVIIFAIIASETLLLWIFSLILSVQLMDSLFLGSIAIFGAIWLFSYFSVQSGNNLNANVRGTTGQNAGNIKSFRFKFASPIILGLIFHVIASFIITIIYYSSYFF